MTEAAKHAQMRAEFERYFSDDGATPAAIERSGEGYRLMQAQASWVTRQFCWDRRATPAPAQPEGEATGWPRGMLQDDDRKLSRALADTPHARANADEAAAAIKEMERIRFAAPTSPTPAQEGKP